jgi:hypothetical protein
MWIFLDKYIHLVSFILEKVKCIAGPSKGVSFSSINFESIFLGP